LTCRGERDATHLTGFNKIRSEEGATDAYLEEVVMNGVEVAGGPFDPEVCEVHWRQKEKNRICT